MSTRFFFTCLVLIQLGCATKHNDSDDLPVVSNWTAGLNKWKNRKSRFSEYEFTLSRLCFCAGPKSLTIKINSSGQVASYSAYDHMDNLIPGYVLLDSDIQSLDELFAFVDQAILADPASLEVDYDDEFGFPLSVSVDFDAQLADDEITYSVTYFKGTQIL